jgi:hypothetical protein
MREDSGTPAKSTARDTILEHPQRACIKNLQMNKMEQKECSLWWQAGAPKF